MGWKVIVFLVNKIKYVPFQLGTRRCIHTEGFHADFRHKWLKEVQNSKQYQCSFQMTSMFKTIEDIPIEVN
jgi:hypothetical protein